MKTYFTFLMSLFLALESHARLMQSWTYEMLNDKATLVVIAIPTKVVETSELAALPNIATVNSDGTKEDVMGKGSETTFQVMTVLKGEPSTKTLVLHHFTLAKQKETISNGFISRGGPFLVSFEANNNKKYLMFLQKEADGRYVAVSGQTDPMLSIIRMDNNFDIVR